MPIVRHNARVVDNVDPKRISNSTATSIITYLSELPSKQPITKTIVPIPDEPALNTLAFDFIIPISNVTNGEYAHRLYAINHLISVLPKNIHLIIVEQIVHPHNTRYKDGLKLNPSKPFTYLQTTARTFNKGWLSNIGAKAARTNNLIFSESDIIMDSNYFPAFEHFIECNKMKYGFGWDNLIYWGKDEKTKVGICNKPIQAKGGIVFFKKDFFWAIGGYSESYLNLGNSMDEDIILRATTQSKLFVFPWTVHHLWHPESPLKNQKTKLKNTELLLVTRKEPIKAIEQLKTIVNLVGKKEFPITAIN